MNRRRGSIIWALLWGCFLSVGGIILYTGYFGTGYITSQRTSMISNETDRAVSARTADVPEAGVTALIMQTTTGEEAENDQVNVSNSSKIDQGVPREQNIKDFPSPVHGSPLRRVGNYYSESFDDYLFHGGMDYAEPEGTMIRATHEGKVIFSGADPILGQKVTLDCGGGWLVTYGGLNNLRVEVGKTVEPQDALGQVGLFYGAESEMDQSQLHYEVWHGDDVQYPQ